MASQQCEKCPGDEDLSEMLASLLERNFIETLVYKKWTTTDRANMILVSCSSENFIHNFILSLKKWKTHIFVAKAQSNYLRQLKNQITPGEFIIIGDYS